MNRRCTVLLAIVAAVWLVAPHPVSAQQGYTSGNGTSGTGRTSGTSSGSSTAGAASTLSSAQGYGLDSRFTGSGFSRFTTGSSAMGQTTAGAGAATSGAFGQSATSSQSGGQNRFGNLGNMGGMGFGGMGGMMGFRNMFGNNSQTNQQTGKVRTHMRLAFDRPTQSQTAGMASARFSGVVKRVLEREDVGGGQVTVLMEGSTAVLTGTVATEHARDVLGNLAMLEPGIGDVRNELLVNPPAPTRANEPKPSTVDQR
jgi:hypothetical protein